MYPILPVLRVINQPSETGSTIAREVCQRRAVPADIYLVEESPIPGSGAERMVDHCDCHEGVEPFGLNNG